MTNLRASAFDAPQIDGIELLALSYAEHRRLLDFRGSHTDRPVGAVPDDHGPGQGPGVLGGLGGRLRPVGRTVPLRPDAARELAEHLTPASPGHPWAGAKFSPAWGTRDVLTWFWPSGHPDPPPLGQKPGALLCPLAVTECDRRQRRSSDASGPDLFRDFTKIHPDEPKSVGT